MNDQTQTLVTIGIPTYNRANSFLPQALESVLHQTHANLEIIVSDNCSDDETRALVEAYQDPRVIYYRHDPAVKPHQSADYCLERATGKYFLLLHDDDLIDHDFVQVCLEAIGDREVGFAHTGARTIDEMGRIGKERKNPHGESSVFEFLDSILRGGAVTYFCNTLYNTRCLKSIDGFRSRAYVYQDVLATVKLACTHERVDIEEAKASYRVHGLKWGSRANLAKWCDDSLEIVEVMCECLPEQKEYFLRDGMRILCWRSYNRAARVAGLFQRIYAFSLVYRKFRLKFSPLEWVSERTLAAETSAGPRWRWQEDA